MENTEMTAKEKIILILRESIRLGKECSFTYHVMLEKHKEIWSINKLSLLIEEKIALFNNLPETSELFQNIYRTAKLALTKLKDDEGYNFYSAELILKINMLEDIFKKKLRPIGSRIIEQIEKPKIIETKTIQTIHDEIEHDEFYDEQEHLKNIELPSGKFLRENITGKKFHNTVMKKQEIKTSLQQSQL